MPTQIQARYWGVCLAAAVLGALSRARPDFAGRVMGPAARLDLHLAAELFVIAVSLMIVALAWHDRHERHASKTNLLVYGFTLVALLDTLHLLNYPGMPGHAAGESVARSLFYQQAARMAETATLLGLALAGNAPDATDRKRAWLLAALASAAALLLAGSYIPMSALYGEANGPALPGAVAQGLIGAANFLGAALFLRHWLRGQGLVSPRLAAACCVLGVGEFTRLSHMGTLDSADLAAHLLTVGVYALLYRIFYYIGVSHPQQRLEQSRHTIARKNREMADIFEAMPMELVQLDARLNYRYANPRHTARLGRTLTELAGTPWFARLADGQRALCEAQLEAALKGRYVEFELREGSAQAITQSFAVRASPQHGCDGAPEGVLLMMADTTEQENTRLMTSVALQEASDLKAALDAHAIVAVTDADGVITKVNDKFCQVSQYRRSELIGQTHAIIRSGMHPREFLETVEAAINDGQVWTGEVCNRAKDGTLFWTHTTIVPFTSSDGTTTQHITIRTDITQRKEAEQQAQQLALYDALTGLPNRRLIVSHIRQACSASTRSRKYGAVMLLDLDNFKEINDTQGHDQGDELLRRVAQRLRENLRASDIVARLGGDEFVILVSDLSDDGMQAGEEAITVAEKVRGALEHAFNLNGRTVHTTLSIGVSIFQGTAIMHEEILKHADMALYRAKARGRNQVSLFDPGLQVEVEHRASLMADLRVALERREMHLHYQVIVDGDQRPLGYEALLRWIHPTRGSVPPPAFIDKAEQSGFIIPLGTWILRTACAQLARWARQPAMARRTLAVNISARQFRAPDFVAIVETTLKHTGADPHLLCLELTESMFHTDMEQSIAKMKRLCALGVRFALDDFGTGYSSLGYLRRMPLDVIKIDKSFVDDILTDPNDAAIAQTILGLANTLELRVVAEGIEEQAQFEWLKERRCDAFQGYFFGRPQPMESPDTEPGALRDCS